MYCLSNYYVNFQIIVAIIAILIITLILNDTSNRYYGPGLVVIGLVVIPVIGAMTLFLTPAMLILSS